MFLILVIAALSHVGSALAASEGPHSWSLDHSQLQYEVHYTFKTVHGTSTAAKGRRRRTPLDP